MKLVLAGLPVQNEDADFIPYELRPDGPKGPQQVVAAMVLRGIEVKRDMLAALSTEEALDVIMIGVWYLGCSPTLVPLIEAFERYHPGFRNRLGVLMYREHLVPETNWVALMSQDTGWGEPPSKRRRVGDS